MSAGIAARLAAVQAEIVATCTAAGRDPDSVKLVAVSKTRPVSDIIKAASAGQQIFGENYVQELAGKASETDLPLQWHFIGHLQSNKVKYLPGIASLIHTVDRLSLAQEIDRQWREKSGKPCNILIQVNVSGEITKSGTTMNDALELVRQVAKLPGLQIHGLMTMPPFFDDPENARPYFRELRLLSDRIREEAVAGVEMKELSMGMSGDFKVAAEEGATLVRIGTAIFGGR